MLENINLLDVSNPKKLKDTLNQVLEDTAESNARVEELAANAVTTAQDAKDLATEAKQDANVAVAISEEAKQISEEALSNVAKKLDKKPDGNIDLINTETGQIDNKYIPTKLSKSGRTYAGVFGEDGIIIASVYASEINGQHINDINRDKCVGYEFTYVGNTVFSLGKLFIAGGVNDENTTDYIWELYKGDVILSNGNLSAESWTIIDNSDKVVSVNGMTGAVELPTGGIEQLVGTKEKPINFATDMEVGNLYSISGYFRINATSNANIPGNLLFYKADSTTVYTYSCGFSGNSFYIRAAAFGKITVNASGDLSNGAIFGGVKTCNGNLADSGIQIYAATNSGSNGQILQSNGAYKAPTWITPNFATIDDINNAIGSVSALLGNTDDLEV